MRRFVMASALVALVTACSPFGTVSIDLPDQEMGAKDTAAVDEAIKSYYTDEIRSQLAPGLWVGIWHPDKGAFIEAYGESVRGQTAATVGDVLRIGSVTKTFTATAILRLVDEGELSLDDTVAEISESVATGFPPAADITVRALLSMTSGVVDYLNNSDGVMREVSQDPATVFESADLLASAVGMESQPAGTPGYTNTAYILLEQIAEVVSGRSLQELVGDLTEELGMTATAIPSYEDTALPVPQTHGYLNELCVKELAGDGGQVEPWQDTSDWNVSYARGAGAMHSTLADLGIWAASMSGSRLLSDSLASERLDAADIGGFKYGLGIIDYGNGFYGHNGEAIGWQARAAHNPDTGVTLVFLANSCAGLDSLLFDPLQNLLKPILEG